MMNLAGIELGTLRRREISSNLARGRLWRWRIQSHPAGRRSVGGGSSRIRSRNGQSATDQARIEPGMWRQHERLDLTANGLGVVGRLGCEEGSTYEVVREGGWRWLTWRGSGGRLVASRAWPREEQLWIALAHMSAPITCE